jgi:hypothetical protein
LPEVDRDINPLDRRNELVAVDEIRSYPRWSGKPLQGYGPTEGASVTMVAMPGLTREYLARVVDCHIELGASSSASMASNPLAVPGATATVASAGTTFRIDIRGSDRDSAKAIALRAKQLGERPREVGSELSRKEVRASGQ